jgi:hypothetical protein
VRLTVTNVDNDDQMLSLEQRHVFPSVIENVAPLLAGSAFVLVQDYDAPLDSVNPAAVSGYDNAELVALLQTMRDTSAGAAENRLIAHAAALGDRDLPWINLLATPVQNVTRANITGYGSYAVPVTYYELLHPR